MTAFLSRVRVEISPPSEANGRNVYTFLEPFVADSNILGRIVIPAGFKTNFASIPRILWRYLDPEDPCICYPSAIHDRRFYLGGKNPDGPDFTFEHANIELGQFMQISGARWDQIKATLFAVRTFGKSHWNTQHI
jgi:hypothetical protein